MQDTWKAGISCKHNVIEARWKGEHNVLKAKWQKKRNALKTSSTSLAPEGAAGLGEMV